MPLYEYKCKRCKKNTEKIQKFSDAEITECPYCGGPLERVVSAAAISFKGGGWFKDGYASAKPSPPGDGSESKGGPETAAAPSNQASAGSDKESKAASAPSAPSTTIAPAPAAAAPAQSSTEKK